MSGAPRLAARCAAESRPALRCASRLNEEQLGFLQSSPPLRIVQACFRATEREDCHDPPDIAAHPARQPRRGRSARSSPRAARRPGRRRVGARPRADREGLRRSAAAGASGRTHLRGRAQRGREAVFHYTEQLDRVRLDADTLRVGRSEMALAHAAAEPAFLETVRRVRQNILSFQLGLLHRTARLAVAGPTRTASALSADAARRRPGARRRGGVSLDAADDDLSGPGGRRQGAGRRHAADEDRRVQQGSAGRLSRAGRPRGLPHRRRSGGGRAGLRH